MKVGYIENWKLDLSRAKDELIPIKISYREDFDKIRVEQDLIRKIASFWHTYFPTIERWKGTIGLSSNIRSLTIITANNLTKLKKYNLNLIISDASNAHHVQDYIVQCIAEILGIHIIYFRRTYFKVGDGTKKVAWIPLLSAFGNNKSYFPVIFNKNKRFEIDFDTSQREYTAKLTSVSTSRLNFLIALMYTLSFWLTSRQRKQPKWSRISISYHFFLIFRQYLFIRNLLKQSEKDPILTEKDFIFFAHQQPEASSWPAGGHLYDQILISKMLVKQIKNGRLFYKEHPTSFKYSRKFFGFTRVGLYRDRKYISDLLNSGIKIISPTSKLERLENFIPVTISGNIGFEKLIEGLQIIVLGFPWWIHLDFKGIYRNIYEFNEENQKAKCFKRKKHNLSVMKKYINSNYLEGNESCVDKEEVLNFAKYISKKKSLFFYKNSKKDNLKIV